MRRASKNDQRRNIVRRAWRVNNPESIDGIIRTHQDDAALVRELENIQGKLAVKRYGPVPEDLYPIDDDWVAVPGMEFE